MCFVRLSVLHCLSGMEREARIGYLCYQAARNQLTLIEMSELFGYFVLDQSIHDLIYTEILLRKMYRK